MSDMTSWLEQIRVRTEQALDRYLPADSDAPERLHQAMRYASMGGGKRVRPLLVHAAGEFCGADAEALDPFAVAVELIHAYSLVHDDLPCMDDDVLRRGQPTVHVKFDEPTALLVGDALQTLAFQVLASSQLAPQIVVQAVQTLAQASGSVGMAGGQAIDLQSVGVKLVQAELETMHRLKTGALIRASLRLGALAAQADEQRLVALQTYGHAIGLAFQVVDDVLDVVGDQAVIGKSVGKDAAADKPTYVALLGLDAARRYATDLADQAVAALSPWPTENQRLVALANYVVRRVC